LVAYNDGDYAGAVDQIWPLKWNIVTIGGSDAQVNFRSSKFYM